MDMFFPFTAQISAVINVVFEYIKCPYFMSVFEGES